MGSANTTFSIYIVMIKNDFNDSTSNTHSILLLVSQF